MRSDLTGIAQRSGFVAFGRIEIGIATEGPGWRRPVGYREIRPSYLSWQGLSDEWAHAEEGLLDKFISLRDADADEICAFAARHGVLCPWRDTSASMSHPVNLRSEFAQMYDRRGDLINARPLLESVEEWRQSARLFEVLIRASARCAAAGKGDGASETEGGFAEARRELESSSSVELASLDNSLRLRLGPTTPLFLFSRPYIANKRKSNEPVYVQDAEVAGLVALAVAQVVESTLTLGLGWHPYTSFNSSGAAEVRLGPRSLLGALGHQLYSAISAEGRRSSICSNCGQTYASKRKPRSDRKNYCYTCSEDGAPSRNRQQAFRERHATTKP